MEAAPSPVGVATASPTPPPEWPQTTQWVSAPAAISVGLASPPAPVWSRSAQGAMACLLLLAVALLGWHLYGTQRWGCRPTVLETGASEPTGVDLNQADQALLLQLPGVGEQLAERIVAYRIEHNGFRTVSELRRVSGIGPALLEKLRPLVYVEPNESEPRDAAPVPAVKPTQRKEAPRAAATKKIGPSEPLDINRATVTELQTLPGIGPKLSARIVEKRDEKAFQAVEELRRVPGIGPKTLERLRPLIKVTPR
jgi:competence protein ComEA